MGPRIPQTATKRPGRACASVTARQRPQRKLVQRARGQLLRVGAAAVRGAGRRESVRCGLAECGGCWEEESWRTPRFLPNHLNASIPGSKNTERGTCGQDCASSLSQEKSEISGGHTAGAERQRDMEQSEEEE